MKPLENKDKTLYIEVELPISISDDNATNESDFAELTARCQLIISTTPQFEVKLTVIEINVEISKIVIDGMSEDSLDIDSHLERTPKKDYTIRNVFDHILIDCVNFNGFNFTPKSGLKEFSAPEFKIWDEEITLVPVYHIKDKTINN
jgi:hypothetical protein